MKKSNRKLRWLCVCIYMVNGPMDFKNDSSIGQANRMRPNGRQFALVKIEFT